MPGHPLRRARRAREPGGLVLLFTGAWSKLRKMSYGLRHRMRLVGLRHRGVDRPRRWLGRPWMTMIGWAIALVAVILVAWMLRSVYVVFFLRRPVERSAERRHPVPGRRRLLRRHQRVDHFAAFHCAGIGRFPVLAVLADGPAVPGQGPAACP